MQRERLTITLEPDLIAAADGLVDKSTIRNRSHAIEHLMKEGLGLHQLSQAFFFIGEGWSQDQANVLVQLCHNHGISQVYLTGKDSADLRLLLSGLNPTDVPSDFGSGGALLLKKDELSHPFLLVWLNASLALPESLVGAYAAHRTRQAAVTQLLVPETEGYRPAGLSIASPSLLDSIPAGIASLEKTVFPELLKKGNLGTYAFPA